MIEIKNKNKITKDCYHFMTTVFKFIDTMTPLSAVNEIVALVTLSKAQLVSFNRHDVDSCAGT